MMLVSGAFLLSQRSGVPDCLTEQERKRDREKQREGGGVREEKREGMVQKGRCY